MFVVIWVVACVTALAILEKTQERKIVYEPKCKKERDSSRYARVGWCPGRTNK